MSDKSKPRPLKRPVQARSEFTVQAIYDTFVRIWLREGWQGVTTRKVAIESGFAIGTIYDYFPNKTALLSGYVRYAIDWTLTTIETEIVGPSQLDEAGRLNRLVELTFGAGGKDQPYFDQDMLLLEEEIAEIKHHRRVYEEVCAAWHKAIKAMPNLSRLWQAHDINAVVLLLWGARRYEPLVQLSETEREQFLTTVQRLIAGKTAE